MILASRSIKPVLREFLEELSEGGHFKGYNLAVGIKKRGEMNLGGQQESLSRIWHLQASTLIGSHLKELTGSFNY